MKVILILLMVSFGSGGRLCGQEEKEATLSAQIRFLAWDGRDEDLGLRIWTNEAGPHRVKDLDAYDATLPLSYQGPAELIFTLGDVDPRKVKEGEEKVAFFRLPIQEDWREVLVLVKRSAKSPSGVELTALDQSVGTFPWGSYRVINTTGVDLKMKLGEQFFKVPKTREPFLVELDHEDKMVQVLATTKERTDPLFMCISKHRKDTRKILVFSRQANARLGVLGVRIIPERKPRK